MHSELASQGDSNAKALKSLLKSYQNKAPDKYKQGRVFEHLTKTYLQLDATQKQRFEQVWLWEEYPNRKGHDIGIDLVAKIREEEGGGNCAIQCKFYDHPVRKEDLDSFLAASSKKEFSARLIVATSSYSKNAEEMLYDPITPINRITLKDLERSTIDWSEYLDSGALKYREKNKLREHQTKAIENILQGFQKSERGKLVMACGTGKTFTSLKLAEKFAKDAKPWEGSPSSHGRILFLAPSIALLSQTLKEWSEQSAVSIHSFVVCSDTTLGNKKGADNLEIRIADLPLPPTTDAQKLANSVKLNDGRNPLAVIFSSIGSSNKVPTKRTT